MLPHKSSINTKYYSFQYQILNNVLCLNKLFSNLEKLNPHFIQFASHQRNNFHLFRKCLCAHYIWNKTKIFFSSYITIPDATPQSTIHGFTDTSIYWFNGTRFTGKSFVTDE